MESNLAAAILDADVGALMDVESGTVTENACEKTTGSKSKSTITSSFEQRKHQCPLCRCRYTALKHLRFHVKRKHPQEPVPKDDVIRGRTCFVPGCHVKLSTGIVLMEHVANYHRHEQIETETRLFAKKQDFLAWKMNDERITCVRYMKMNRPYKRKDGWINCCYNCQGSKSPAEKWPWKYKNESPQDGGGVRCPAMMIASTNPGDGTVVVNVLRHHVGHNLSETESQMVVPTGMEIRITTSSPTKHDDSPTKADHSNDDGNAQSHDESRYDSSSQSHSADGSKIELSSPLQKGAGVRFDPNSVIPVDGLRLCDSSVSLQSSIGSNNSGIATINVEAELGKRLIDGDVPSVIAWLQSKQQQTEASVMLWGPSTSTAVQCHSENTQPISAEAHPKPADTSAVVVPPNHWTRSLEEFKETSARIVAMVPELPPGQREETSAHLRAHIAQLYALICQKFTK